MHDQGEAGRSARWAAIAMAKALVRQHGPVAEEEAKRRAAAASVKSDEEAAAAWAEVAEPIRKGLSGSPCD
jgi:hypothetical protein